jgi:hypothetical protein
VAPRLSDGRWIRVLTVVDQHTRECPTFHANAAPSGEWQVRPNHDYRHSFACASSIFILTFPSEELQSAMNRQDMDLLKRGSDLTL